MLNDKEIVNYYKNHEVIISCQQYIDIVRTNESSRLVGRQGGNNVCTNFVSRKMGRSIQTESRTAELPHVIEFEYDENILEFWDQPQPLTIYRTYKNGNVRPGSYTPDFLLLTTTGPIIIEVKTEENLATLVKKKPDDWVITTEGVTYRPAKEEFAKIGLDYKVYSTSQINLIRTENLKLLLNSRRVDQAWDDNFYRLVRKELGKHSWLKLSDLALALRIKDLTPFIQMIDHEVLHASLGNELLSQAESTWVSSSIELAELGFHTRNSTNFSTDISDIPINKVPTEKQAKQALKILAKIKSGEKGRCIRRWRAKIKKGKELGLTAFQSLLPNYFLSGNRSNRLNKIITDFIDTFIKDYYSTPLRLMPARAFDLYKKLAKETHPAFPPVSRPTLIKYIKAANQQSIARGRGGKRAANAAENPTDVSERGFLATVPFELASLDHYLVDQECVIAVSDGKTYTAKPWATALIDVFSKVVLAVWLSFRAPSMRACGMVLRMCARNHGRLPKAAIVDRGAEFESVYFDSLLGHFEIDLTKRPSSHPRFGSEIERFFLLYKTQWLALRPGNTALYKESRAVSGSHSPTKLATLSIENTWNEINQYIQSRNGVITGNQKLSPITKFNASIEQYPFVGIRAQYNDEFKVRSAVDSGKYTVDPSRGIHIDGTHYWSPELSQLSTRSKKVEVRHEPENPHQIYAQVNNKWVSCYGSQENTFKTKDPVIRLAEAARILDCRSIRDNAKEEANQSLIKHIHNFDDQYRQQNKPSDNTNKEDAKQSIAKNHGSIFEHLLNTTIEKIQPEKWEA